MRFFFLFPFCLLLLPPASLQAQTETEVLEDFLKKEKIEAAKTEQGLYYTIEKIGNAKRPKRGDYVLVHYEGQLLDGTVFDATEKEGFIFQVGYRQVIRGIDQGVQLLGEKGEINLYVPAFLGYGEVGAGDLVPAGAALRYELELEKILSPAEYDQYMLQLEKKEKEAYEKEMAQQLKKDIEKIKDFAEAKNLNTAQTPSGLHYSILRKGSGKAISAGSHVTVEFESYLPDGTLFDSTKKKGSAYQFIFGKDKLIDGWDEGLPLLNEGSEAWLLVPSGLAFGPEEINENNVHIPPYSVLFFYIKVIKVN